MVRKLLLKLFGLKAPKTYAVELLSSPSVEEVSRG